MFHVERRFGKGNFAPFLAITAKNFRFMPCLALQNRKMLCGFVLY